jgi:hypothetical protein
MSKFTSVIPTTRAAVYKAAELIVANGPQSREALSVAIDFGVKGTHVEKLRQAIEGDWLVERASGLIDVTESTRAHFASQAPKEKYIGQITPAQYRPSVFASPGLSKKNIPSRRGQRDDIPAWSVRDKASLKSLSGGES